LIHDFFCGFCRGDRGESFCGDRFSK